MQVGIELLSQVPPEKRQEFIQSFKVLPPYKGCNENCVFHRLFEDVGELNRFLWVEHWRNENTLKKYIQSDRFKTILGAVEALGELIHFNKIEIKKIQN